MPSSILIVDPFPAARIAISGALEQTGHRSRFASTGAEAISAAGAEPTALVILELELPDIAGFDVCRTLRDTPRTATLPILILSTRDEEVDRVVCFELGADDFVSKPFSPLELRLRVEAVIRRSMRGPQPRTSPGLTCGPLRLDLDRRAAYADGEELALTQLEFALLKTLLEQPNEVLTRAQLLSDLWGQSAKSRTLDTHVKRLRQKLGPSGRFIQTVRGMGYGFFWTEPRAIAHG